MTYYYNEEIRRDSIEHITIQSGWYGLVEGYFCKIERENLCVEDFGTSKRSALKYARKAWDKENEKKKHKELGYPRIIECGKDEDG